MGRKSETTFEPVLPRGKPDKYGEIRDRLWPGVHEPGDGRFVFSEETSSLTDQEFSNAIYWLDLISSLVNYRDHEVSRNPSWGNIFNPNGAWHREYQNSIENDNSIRNIQTSYRLLAEKDRDVIRKLRFYTETFTGYQLATLALAGTRPWISDKLPENWDETLQRLAGPPTSDVYHCVVAANALPDNLRVRPPKKFGEIGWLYKNQIVNEDVYGYQHILALMHENGLIELLMERLTKKGHLKIIEIGGGYGALAYYLIGLFRFKVRYGIIDIPESLAFSSIYCSTLLDQTRCELVNDAAAFELSDQNSLTFIPNMFYKNLSLDNGPIDLCINTLSLAEMSPEQVEDYCSSISQFIGQTGIFFEQNRQENELALANTFPQYFKNLRKCTTNLLTNYPDRRGEANLWVNLGWSA